ncbi:MAG: LptE family protein [Candidatus Omnitrophota bacterium]
MKTIKKRFLAVFFILLFLQGCGYTTGSLLPSHLKTIYIEDFKNGIAISNEPSGSEGYKLYRPGVENEITAAIIDQFIFDGILQVVSNDNADLVLSGEITDYYKEPLRYDNFDNVEEYRIIVTINMKLMDATRDKIMWEANGFIGYATYRLTGAFATDEEEAREGAIKDLAQKVSEKVVEAW